MSKKVNDDLLTPRNLYLFNLLFRHQVYLEGVKAGFAGDYKAMLVKLYGEFAKFMAQSRYSTLDAYTRAQFQQFVRLFQLAQQDFFSQYTAKLIVQLQAFVKIDADVSSTLFASVVPEVKAPELNSDSLWATISKSIIPATGISINDTLDLFGTASSNQVTKTIGLGHINGDTTHEVLEAIGGSGTVNSHDGLFNRFIAQQATVVGTVLQHVSNSLRAAIAVEYARRFQWVSIMDNKTSPICIDRNGNVYIYGTDPIPPAHYGCRSKDVALVDDDELHDIPDTYYDWLREQPEAVLVDMLGRVVAAQIVGGDTKLSDLSVSDAVIPLTLAQFHSKLSFMVLTKDNADENEDL